MNEELKAIEKKNQTWELTIMPPEKKLIGDQWIYKRKYRPDGEFSKYKARLVAKVYAQEHGIDYEDIFALVARMETIRVMSALAA